MALAMTVGATKIRIQQEGALASMHKGGDSEASGQKESEAAAPEETCAT